MEEVRKIAYNADEAAKLLGISKVLMYNLMHTPGFPVIKVSANRYIIPVDKFNTWLNEHAG